MSKQYWANLALSLVLGSLAIFALANLGSALTPKGLLATEPVPSPEATPLLSKVVLSKYQLGESPDRVVEANFYVENKSGKDVKNIEVMCEFFDRPGMGHYVDREKWLLPKTVPAGQAVRINQAARRFVSTQAQAYNCRITDFQLVGEPFFSLERVAAAGHGSGHGDAPQTEHGHSAPAGSGH